MTSTAGAKDNVGVKVSVMLQPTVRACGPELYEVHILHVAGTWRRVQTEHRDTIPCVRRQRVGVDDICANDMGYLPSDRKLGKTTLYFFQPAIWSRGGEVD